VLLLLRRLLLLLPLLLLVTHPLQLLKRLLRVEVTVKRLVRTLNVT
jgi:hypothetical protein